MAYTPIRLHPDNPHYFLFRDKPTILFTSGEHYAVVMNKSFDYIKYLDELAACGFNHTRVYTGLKRERPGEYSIDGNNLAVEEKDFIGPWPRTDVPGALDGGNKYDLDKWNDEYFARFRDVLTEAGKRGIELEIILFGPLHMGGDGVGPWGICPMNAANNINGVGDINFWEFNTLMHPDLVARQDDYIRKFVHELNEFDNFHFEICNEPYTDSTNGPMFKGIHTDETMRLAWQQHVADVIWEEESKLPNRHLISSNYQAGFYTVTKPLNHVDLYSFHYTTPDIVARNYDLGKAIGMNETGIMEPPDYPGQCWKTVLGGLALYNLLDYTFTPGHEDGTYEPLPTNPGYTGMTGPALRAELKVVNEFINSFEFVKMRPAHDLLVYDTGLTPHSYILAEENRQYAVYHTDTQHSGYGHSINVALKAEDGEYEVSFIDARTGVVKKTETVCAKEGRLELWYADPTAYPANHACRNAIRITRVHKE